jgi:predicted Rossmann fold nucleotide-binding protein DprA/Smf involved in DNA uptake
MESLVRKIISGGQTGVDRAALDVAIFLGIEHAGWCPAGRIAEDGIIPEIYRLKETDSYEYASRTERNVVESDGTLILFLDELSGGSLFTERMARKHRRPCLALDLKNDPDPAAAQLWLAENSIAVLNVAGPRASSSHEITSLAEGFLLRLLEH